MNHVPISGLKCHNRNLVIYEAVQCPQTIRGPTIALVLVPTLSSPHDLKTGFFERYIDRIQESSELKKSQYKNRSNSSTTYLQYLSV